MNKTLNARITRYLLIQRISDNWLVAIVGPLVIAGLLIFTLNQPISRKMIEARFVRWTIDQVSMSNYGTVRYVIYCDLLDGRTVMANAGPGWVPPHPGDTISIEEQKMFWGGLRYRIP